MANVDFSLAYPPQHVEWSDYLASAVAADGLRFKTFWTWDHLFPISGDLDGLEHECYTTLAALAQATKRIRVGALVSGVMYRRPALQLKMATEIDVISGGRFDFGIGAAWAEREFRAFDIPFPPPKERIGTLRDTLQLASLAWNGDPRRKISYHGKYVQVDDFFLNPQPIQKPHPPILVGGAGEQLTLRVVAQYADVWHGFGDPATLRRKIELIEQYAPDYGREGADVVKSTTVSIWVGDLTDAELQRLSRVVERPAEQIRATTISGDAQQIESRLRAFVDVGITDFIVSAYGPTELPNWRRISEQIIPRFARG